MSGLPDPVHPTCDITTQSLGKTESGQARQETTVHCLCVACLPPKHHLRGPSCPSALVWQIDNAPIRLQIIALTFCWGEFSLFLHLLLIFHHFIPSFNFLPSYLVIHSILHPTTSTSLASHITLISSRHAGSRAGFTHNLLRMCASSQCITAAAIGK